MSALCEIFHFRGGEGQSNGPLVRQRGRHTPVPGGGAGQMMFMEDGQKLNIVEREVRCPHDMEFAVKATIKHEADRKGKQRNRRQQKRDRVKPNELD